MKKIIFSILFLLPILASSQTLEDSLKNRIALLEKGLMNVSDNLYNSHAQFRTGGTLAIMGGIVTAGGMLALSSGETSKGLNMGLIGGGALLSLIGGAIMFSSHKYIGYAGELELSPTGIKIIKRFN